MLFDIAPSEFLLTALVAIVVIGPKDMPRALRTAGRWMGKMRRVSGHFRTGIETMIREAEMEEMEKKWRDQNAAIMEAHPEGAPVVIDAVPQLTDATHAPDGHGPVEPHSVDAPHTLLPHTAPAPAAAVAVPASPATTHPTA